MDIRIANATASMDGLMSKEDYIELNTTIPGQIEDLKEADSNLNNRIDNLDDKIDKEIADREAEIDRIENKFDGVTDELEAALQKEIEDRKAGDTTITNSLNALLVLKVSLVDQLSQTQLVKFQQLSYHPMQMMYQNTLLKLNSLRLVKLVRYMQLKILI